MRCKVLLGLVVSSFSCLTTGRAVETSPPKLAVVISIDQFRADYLQRFRPFFVEDGFNRLLTQGSVFSECHDKHAFTVTAPGHATLMTGVHANVHGIINNEWLEPDTFLRHTSVEDKAYPLVGVTEIKASAAQVFLAPNKSGASPARLLADTLGDRLKAAYGAQSRVISLSNKDRAAILMGGHKADAAYWMEDGNMVSSRYYMTSLPAWVAAFNGEGRAKADFGRVWDRLLDPKVYEQVQGRDDGPGEDNRLGLGITFPHTVNGGKATPGEEFQEAHRLTPFSTELLETFAEKAVSEERLGSHEKPDLLCVSFSQIDYAGHTYGPDSHEVMDSVVRIDRQLAKFFHFLDTAVGAGNYVVVLSADHGVTPLPEHEPTTNPPGSRFFGKDLEKAIDAALTAAFGPAPAGDAWFSRDASGYRLRPAALAANHADRAAAAEVVKQVVAKHPQIAAAFTAKDLLELPGDEGALQNRVRLGFNTVRSPDVVYVLQPYVVAMGGSPGIGGTTHGMPYDCDDHVPLVFLGKGVPAAVSTQRVWTEDLVTTLAPLLGVPAPAEAKGRRLF